MIRPANSTFEAVVDFYGLTGLGSSGTGALTFRVEDNQGNVVSGPTNVGIIELATGIYSKTDAVAPAAVGQFTIIWDDGDGNLAIEDLLVVPEGTPDAEFPPLPSGDGPAAPVLGPCTAWTDGEGVADCTGIEVTSDNSALLDEMAAIASMLLYEGSMRQYSGVCDQEVRPCSTRRACLSEWGLFDGERGYRCGCGALSEVMLPGYPVTSITEVLVDGDVVDPDTYELRDFQRLVRTNDPDTHERLFWPACQDMGEKDLTADGTFVVRYLNGVNPPPIGIRAANELGGELYRACPGTNAGVCRLPSSVTSIVRQGVTMNFDGFRSLSFDRSKRAWNTGMALVDAFLNTYNPRGFQRPAAFFSPQDPYFAERTGISSSS